MKFEPGNVERWLAETFYDKELVDVVRGSDYDALLTRYLDLQHELSAHTGSTDYGEY